MTAGPNALHGLIEDNLALAYAGETIIQRGRSDKDIIDSPLMFLVAEELVGQFAGKVVLARPSPAWR